MTQDSGFKVIILILALAAGVLLILPQKSFALTTTGCDVGEATSIPFWGPFVSCSGPQYINCDSSGKCQENRCACKPFDQGGKAQLIQTFINVVYFGMTVALFVLAPILFAWGGILIMIGASSIEEIGGKKASISKGRSVITGTFVGVLIVLVAYVLVKTFINVLGIGGVGGF